MYPFLRIFTVAFDIFFLVRLGKLRVNDCPAGDRNRKTTVKIQRNPLHHKTDYVYPNSFEFVANVRRFLKNFNQFIGKMTKNENFTYSIE